LKYWEERVQANGRFENVYTVGHAWHPRRCDARWRHASRKKSGATRRRFFSDQRALLAKMGEPGSGEGAADFFVPIKKWLDIYRHMPAGPPDDVTLVWPDDNFGYVRQFFKMPRNGKRKRRRAGVYYHISYWGRALTTICGSAPRRRR